MSIKIFYDEHFKTWIYAAYGEKRQTYIDFVNKNVTRKEDRVNMSEGNVGCIQWGYDQRKKRRIMFLWTLRKDVSHLVHEVMHVILEFGNYFGTIRKATTEDQEHTAMFAEYLVRKITEKEEKKHGRVHKKKA